VHSLARTFGGPPRNVVELAHHLVAAGVEVRILTTDAAHPASSTRRSESTRVDLVEGAESLDVRTFHIGHPYRICYAKGLARAAKEEAKVFDVVDIHSMWVYPSWAGYIGARESATPYIVWPHGATSPSAQAHGRVSKGVSNLVWHDQFLRQAAAFRVATPREGDWTTSVCPGPRVFVVPNGLDVVRFSASTPSDWFIREYLGGRRPSLVLLALGRVAAIKGLEVAVDCLASLSSDGSTDSVLCVVGPDSDRVTEALRNRARKHGVASRVVFTGALSGEHLASAIAAAHVLVMPSHTECFGNALVEALAAGVPAVVSPGVALGSRLSDAGAGLIAPATGGAFADAVRRLVADPDHYSRSRSAAARLAREFDWATVLPGFIQMYETVLRSQRDHAARSVKRE
jgi:glycosyltransferase involved in cell wall biosynthesis